MASSNAEIARALERVAILLELEDANPFRVRAYRNAGRVVEALPEEISVLLEKGEILSSYDGIGKDLAQKIEDFIKTGRLAVLDELARHHPKGIVELTQLPNIGPKRIRLLHDKLGICSLKGLKQAAERGKISEVRGFGKKTEKKLLEDLYSLMASGENKRLLWIEAHHTSELIVKYLKESQLTEKVEVAGSYRRRKETVGDLDILVTTKKAKELVEYFIAYEEVLKVLAKGTTRSTVVLKSGLHVDLRVLKEESFGTGLYYFTGSRSHNIEVRKMAKRRGLKINEYGLYKGAKRLAGRSENEIFQKLGLDFIPPELRENQGEIKAAEEHLLPDLITRKDIIGDLHLHTVASDGRNTIEEMAEAAKNLGHKYLAITDHSVSLRVAKGLDVKRLKKHIQDIEKVNARLKGIVVLKGIEVDILEDGSLDLPDSILKELDIRVCSVHSRFKMNKEKMTERILRAMENPYFDILGHPTGRLLLKRAPYELDLDKIARFAAERNIFLEIDSQPDRLDLNAELARMAQHLGTKFVITSDAHSMTELSFLDLGVAQARRGWIEKKNVMNTLEWDMLKKRMQREAGESGKRVA